MMDFSGKISTLAGVIGIGAALTISPVSAQRTELGQTIDWSPIATQECLARTGDHPQCIGTSAAVCQDRDGTFSMAAMTACFDVEHAYWDRRLNAAFQVLLEKSKPSANNGMNFQTDLRNMQRNWINFRDEKCLFAATLFHGGSFAIVAEIQCQMQETGRQALFLEQSDMAY